MTILPDLIERNFGVLTGKPISNINLLPKNLLLETEGVTYFLNAEGAENFPACYDRARRVLKQIMLNHQSDENILLVAHGDIGKMLYAAANDIPWREALTHFHFKNTQVIPLSKKCLDLFMPK